MFASVLIANRGEIAVRIARTAKMLGMRTIAVYSEADKGALHTRVCDEAVLIGPAAPGLSYLAVERLIDAARRTGAACVHPGYGFLSENAEFAEACAAAGLVFVGPPPAAMRAMGLKDHAKALMEAAGVPVVPGYHGEQQELAYLNREADLIGYPVLIKAVAGGGGRGLRRVDAGADFAEALASAQREAMAAFGNARVLIEKYVQAPRHIEIQVFADRHGNTIHLNERDCSLQRRHQKVIEEAPAPGMTPALRAEFGEAAVKAARAVGYVGAGTVEFIADAAAGLRSGAFWFMEMNTRLQVEHPVTEAITGLDLVAWQFRIAAGEPLPLAQTDVKLDGHAIEARVYAEDPDRGFLPSPGRVAVLELPAGEGIRVDTGVAAGDAVPADYDAMIAKVIAHAPTRAAALDRLAAALDRMVVVGPRVNKAFLRALITHPAFRAGGCDTGFIARHLDELLDADPAVTAPAVAHAVALLLERERQRIAAATAIQTLPSGQPWHDPWSAHDGFALGPAREVGVDILVDGGVKPAGVAWDAGGVKVRFAGASGGITAPGMTRTLAIEGGLVVLTAGRQHLVSLIGYDRSDASPHGDDGVLRAPMNGRIVAVLVEAGQAVKQGDRLILLEAMKMEHALVAPFDGVVAELTAAAGDPAAEGAALVRIAAAVPAIDKP